MRPQPVAQIQLEPVRGQPRRLRILAGAYRLRAVPHLLDLARLRAPHRRQRQPQSALGAARVQLQRQARVAGDLQESGLLARGEPQRTGPVSSVSVGLPVTEMVLSKRTRTRIHSPSP